MNRRKNNPDNKYSTMNKERDREFGFKQTHAGRERFPSGSWGASSEFGHNSNFHESDSYNRDQRPFDMDNYYSGRQFSVGGMDFDREERDDEFSNRQYDRSRFAEPYTAGQFARSQYSRGPISGWDRAVNRDEERYFANKDKEFYGKGPKGYKRSDERIREEVCEALFRSPKIDASDIEVSVKDGNVTLKGEVESRSAKRDAEDCVENITGVQDVQNELRLIGISQDSAVNKESGNLPSH